MTWKETPAPVLIIMAAGMGSRYGGLKQIEPVGPNGEIIMDYSIHDAIKAGFGKVVFVIKEELMKEFHHAIGRKVETKLETAYVYQRKEQLPLGFAVVPERKKPWGTGQAVLSCRAEVLAPFMVINADDFYGTSTFRNIADFLQKKTGTEESEHEYCMAGFELQNTLTEHGYVARGICTMDKKGWLSKIQERTKIIKSNETGTIHFEDHGEPFPVLDPRGVVSMNAWGFTPQLFDELEIGFATFLKNNQNNLIDGEYYLPGIVNDLVSAGKAKVKVIPSGEKWYGITYKQDKPGIEHAIAAKIDEGIYPRDLWGDGNGY